MHDVTLLGVVTSNNKVKFSLGFVCQSAGLHNYSVNYEAVTSTTFLGVTGLGRGLNPAGPPGVYICKCLTLKRPSAICVGVAVTALRWEERKLQMGS